MGEKARVPRTGAGQRLAKKLNELGQQPPPESLVNKISREEKKKVASQACPLSTDLEAQ